MDDSILLSVTMFWSGMKPEIKLAVIQCVAGVTLLAVTGYGICYGIQASIAQAIYHEAKYVNVKDDARLVLNRCEEAYDLYPRNYYFSIWAAEKAYYTSFGVDKTESQKLLAASERWCDIGLIQNPYNDQLRMLKTHLLAKDSIPDAIKYWEPCVEWQFWEPYNHAVLAELYAKSGQFEKAFDSLKWVEGSKYYAETARKIKDAWYKDMKPAVVPKRASR
jgi:tetratricopeptide (TPR) repeat protein